MIKRGPPIIPALGVLGLFARCLPKGLLSWGADGSGSPEVLGVFGYWLRGPGLPHAWTILPDSSVLVQSEEEEEGYPVVGPNVPPCPECLLNGVIAIVTYKIPANNHRL